MKLSKHPIPSVEVLFCEGYDEGVEYLYEIYKEKLETEYVKPNPFNDIGDNYASGI